MQPQFVFARVERLHRGRGGELGEPGVRGGRQLGDLLACCRRERASEPRLRERERHCLKTAQGGRLEAAPFGPEFVICGVPMEETGELVDVEYLRAAMEDVLEQMERGVRYRILRAEHVHFRTADGAPHAACPEIFDAGRFQPFQLRIPELEVQLDGEGHFGIEIIAAPAPRGAREQPRQMVGGELFHAGDAFVILGEQSVAGGFQGLAGEVEIDIVLRAILRADAKEFAVGDAFQSDEFAGQTGEAAIRFFGHLHAQTILARGISRRFRQNSAEQEREALAIAPGESVAAGMVIETDESVRGGFT